MLITIKNGASHPMVQDGIKIITIIIGSPSLMGKSTISMAIFNGSGWDL